ncbi:hypothetical protein LCGC14_1809400, partial [marine sediment metagenome]
MSFKYYGTWQANQGRILLGGDGNDGLT